MFAAAMPRDEFRRRRECLFDTVGRDAAVLVQGGPADPAHALFRQTNDFYYLCGVEVPHAYLLLDGRNRVSTFFLPHQRGELVDREGERLSPENARQGVTLTGLDEILGLEELPRCLEKIPVLYVPFRHAEGPGMSWDTLEHAQRESYADPFDGRPSRSRHFLQLVRERCPGDAFQEAGG